MTKETLLSLADRLEAATGPDRELDEEITAALAGATREVQSNGDAAYYRDNCWVPVGPIQPFTASLDAAMSLVPEEWFRRLDDLGADGLPLAMLYAPDQPNHVGIARNITLALCAAALRARTAQ